MSSERRQSGLVELIGGRYELRSRVAGGGMGEVFSTFDRSTGKLVALKRLRSTLLAQRSLVIDFMREYHALCQLRHPRIIDVYDYGVDSERPYYTMELLDGQDLSDLSPLPTNEACLYLRDVASSLALLHARRLLHRDVSPRNVRRTSDGHCKLLDFGAMIAFGIPPNVTGTAPCIAPEALQGAALDQRTDLYSLGALAYRVLTGHYAHAVSELDDLPAAWDKPLVPPKHHVPALPDALNDLVMSLLNLDPMKRPKSAAEVIDWLSAIGQLPIDDTVGTARSFLISSQLCGRETARKLIKQCAQQASLGHGTALLIEGRSGSGKSRMLAEAALIAQASGLATLRAIARPQHAAGYMLAHDLVTTLRHMLPLEAQRANADRLDWRRSSRPPTQRHTPIDQGSGGEARGRLQQALTDVFCSVASARPLLIAVDDLDRADEFSTAFIAALMHQARELPLFIVASHSQAHDDQRSHGALAFANLATRVHIADLDRVQIAELVESMFGRVPNISRLSDWLFRVAHGNPKATLASAEHLLSRDVVRYVAGNWILPDDIVESIPEDLSQALALRVRSLSAAAQGLVELLSVRRGGATTELCLQLAGSTQAEVFIALDELVTECILERAGHEYVFTQHELRNAVRQALSTERAQTLHQCWADALLAQHERDADAELEAGWHMLHGGDELRGAELLARVAPLLVDQGLAMATALPAIEAALSVYERRQGSLQIRLRLRSTLVLAGYLFDYRLALRYGDETLELLYRASGMALAERLTRFVGGRLAIGLALVCTEVRRWLTPSAQRPPPLSRGVQYFARTAMGLMGMRAVGLDAQATSAILAKVAPLGNLPVSAAGRLLHQTCQAIALQMLGREADVDAALQRALASASRKRSSLLSELEHQSLVVGLLTADGMNECYRESSRAEERAEALERIGTRMAQAAACRIRLTMALTRCDLERAEHYRRLIDLHGIQGGTTWQVEWFAVPIEGMLGGATWTDLVLLRRAVERLERLAQEMPSLEPHWHSVRIAFHWRRGESAVAAQLGEDYIARHPPRSLIGWGFTYAISAFAMIESGRAERAQALCEDALAHVSQADRAYAVMYGQLEMAHATALAVLGQRERCETIVGQRIERLRACGDHAGLVVVHQDQARIARLLNDQAGLRAASRAMREEALAAGAPALLLLADRMAELRASLSPELRAQQATETSTARSSTQDEPAVTKFLRGCRSATERGRQALHVLARYAASDEAYLFSWSKSGLTQVAATNGRERPEPLTAKLRELIASHTDPVADSPAVLVTARNADDSEELRYRVLLLASERAGNECVGVAAVRESEESSVLVGPMIADLRRVLADDLREHSKRSR